MENKTFGFNQNYHRFYKQIVIAEQNYFNGRKNDV